MSEVFFKIPYKKGDVCKSCPIYKSYGHDDYVPFELVGNNPEIAVVGEAPGNDEVKEGRPFIGRSGKLLRKALSRAGVDSYLILNAVSCRPRRVDDDGVVSFREPTRDEYKTCSIHAKEILKKFKVKTVILAGKTAVKAFKEVFPEDISTWGIGKIISEFPVVEKEGVRYYVVNHPSYVLRGGMPEGEYLATIARIVKQSQGELTLPTSIEKEVFYRDELVPVMKSLSKSPRWKRVALDYETNTASPVESRKLIGIGLSNGSESIYFELRLTRDGEFVFPELTEEEAQVIESFLSSREAVIVYNTSFESNVTYQVTGKWMDFDDAYTLAKIAQIRDQYRGGGLKYVASAVLGVPAWSGDVSDSVRKIKRLLTLMAKNDFIRDNLAAISDRKLSGAFLAFEGHMIPLITSAFDSKTSLAEFAQSVSKDLGLSPSKENKLKKTLFEILEALYLFKSSNDLTEVVSHIEIGRKHGLEDEYLYWYAIPTSELAEYNAKDTLYTFHVFKELYERYGKWYPYYIKQEWLSSHMEGYMIAWDSRRAEELAKLYAMEAINHIEKIFNIPKFRKALLDYKRENVTIAELEKAVSVVPKLSSLPKTTRDAVRKKTVGEFKKSYNSIISNLNYLKKSEESTILLASLLGVLDRAVDEYLEGVERSMDESVSRARKLIEEGKIEEAVKEVKSVFNPDSSHGSTRSVFFNAFMEEVLEVAVILDYVNQTFFKGEPKFTLDNIEEFQEWVKALKGEDKKKYFGYKKFLSTITKGINDDFFKAWYQVFNVYFGVQVDDRSTWNIGDPDLEESWLLLYHTRVFKKIMKALNGYILAGKKDALGAIIEDPTKPVIAYGKYDGRGTAMLETTFHANTAETKRWQSPIHTIPRGSDIRLLYVPRSDEFLIVHFDYSQMEVRVLAGLSGDPVLLEAYEKGIDVHRLTASRIFNKPPEEVTKEERSFAKAATFSVLYGKGVESFARDFLHGDVDRARDIIEGFFRAYPKVDEWVKKMHEIARETGNVSTIFGDPINVNHGTEGWDRRAQNYPIQSSASSLAALSGWELYQTARKAGMRVVVIGFTHDAFDFEVDARDLPAFMVLAKKLATSIPRRYGIPAEIDLEVGPNMGHMFEIKKEGNLYHVHGPKEGFDDLIARLSRRWNLEYEITGEDSERREERELFVTKTAYSVSIGKEIPLVRAEVKLLGLKS